MVVQPVKLNAVNTTELFIKCEFTSVLKLLYTDVHNSQKVETTQSSSTDEGINKIWYIHKMKYYSAIKMNEIPIHVKIMMNFEIIMLNENSQTQMVTYYIILFI